MSWQAAADGGSPITGQTVKVYTGGSIVGQVSVAPAGTSVTIKGLRAGAAYVFTVAAANAVGAGPESTASNTVIPRR